jgi:hypothetical protein
MRDVLRNVPEMPPARPEGIQIENVDPKTGAPSSTGAPEYFLQESLRPTDTNILGLPAIGTETNH